MTDRYETLREAEGSLPPWVVDGWVSQRDSMLTRAYLDAVDPAVVGALLAERDALAELVGDLTTDLEHWYEDALEPEDHTADLIERARAAVGATGDETGA